MGGGRESGKVLRGACNLVWGGGWYLRGIEEGDLIGICVCVWGGGGGN